MTQTIHRLSFTLDFPAGLAPGENASGNELAIARDGQGRPILRGSALAGVLRSLWRTSLKRQAANPNTVCDADPDVIRYFGVAPTRENDAQQESPLRAPDCLLDLGREKEVVRRTHHQRCRHMGRVMDGALFSLEACPPGTKCRVTLWLEETREFRQGDAEEFLARLLALLSRGAVFGGNGNRGIGLAVVEGDYAYRSYDLSSLEDYAAWLDDDRAVREGKAPQGSARLPEMAAELDTLRVDFTLTVPPGQDILIGDGQGLEAQSQPQRVTAADGRDYWRLPGATLGGCFRDWMTHLAAKEGKPVADSCQRYEKDGPATGDALGWLFAQEKDPEIHAKYPVADLFGSLHKAGRLHVADAFSMVSNPSKDASELSEMRAEAQYRPHVALDAITGGAVEHFFFDDIVLTEPRPFHVTMLLRSPSEDDAQWLAAALDALNRGQLRVGSSKSAGRLVLTESPKAVGPHAEWFEMLEPYADSPADAVVEDAAATSPGATSASEPSADSPSGAEPGYITGVLRVSRAKKGNKIIKIEYQRPDKNKPTQRDYTSLAMEARGFNESDAEDGDPVHVFLDETNQPERAVIPGKTEVTLSQGIGGASSGKKPVDTNKLAKGSPSLLGQPFHNPYTFIPFPEGAIARGKPTPRTADERSDSDRFTGILELDVTTASPLLSMLGRPKDPEAKAEHHVHEALTIGGDVIVPATSIRGFLRYLMTVLTGGPLTLLDDSLYLCQGRDAQLGPRGKTDNKPPKEVFLARVVEPGDGNRPGKVELGRTVLKNKESLEKYVRNLDPYRPKAGTRIKHLWALLDEAGEVLEVGEDSQNGRLPWQVKLSGRPVNTKNVKREGLFLGEGKKAEITLPPTFWAQYSARNRHGVRPELKKDDLVWLEPVDPELEQIRHPVDVRSIQWARWGRHGRSIMKPEILREELRPDYMRKDGLVSEVTDLFGLASAHRDHQDAPRFAGRVRPENLVFSGAKAALTEPIPLAVMSSPHPGCVPFYRKNNDVNAISTEDPLRGYKVYRTSKHAGVDDPLAPWRFENQGTYDAAGRVDKDHQRKVNFTAPLLPDGQTGRLRIAVRALSRKELALLVLACKGTWRLGGGKPLGLGACRVRLARMLDERGTPVEPNLSDEEIRRLLGPEVLARFRFWQASQRPVETMRYPRLVNRNKNKNSRGGLVWFQQCAQPKAVPYEQGKTKGLRPIYVCDGLKEAVRAAGVDNSKLGKDVDVISGQMLPPLDAENPDADLLYGYDCIFVDEGSGGNASLEALEAKSLEFNTKRNTQNCRPAVEPFDEEKHITGSEAGGENESQNWKTRQKRKDDREKEN